MRKISEKMKKAKGGVKTSVSDTFTIKWTIFLTKVGSP